MSQQVQSEDPVLLEVVDGVGIITLNRPHVYNAMNQDLADGLLRCLITCDEDPNVRAAMIAANGPAFCAGGDIRQMQAHVERDGHAGRFLKTLTVALHGAIATISHMPKPVVTAVNGAAAGAGFSLAIAGDIVLGGSDAKFTVAYTAIGLSPDGSLTHHLPRLIGPKLAFELTCMNRTISAEEARALGIVAQVFPAAELHSSARDYVARLSQGPTQALGCAKKLFATTFENSIETQMEHERQLLVECGRTDDFKEGIGAFLAKKTASFRGR